jgi:two-component system sensor kinase FixL
MLDETNKEPGGMRELDALRQRVAELERSLDDQQRSLAAACEERDRLRMYLDMAGGILVALDRTGKITMINRRGCQVLECEAGELIGQSWFETCLPAKDRSQARAVFQRLVSGEQEVIAQFENAVLTHRGKERIVAWHNTLLRNEKQEILGTLSSGKDVTEQRALQEALQESQALLQLVYDNAFDGIGVFEEFPGTGKRRLIDCNQRYAEMSGRSKEALLAIGDIGSLQQNLGPPRSVEENWRLRRQELSYRGLFSWLRPDGKENVIEYSASPIHVGGRALTIGVDRDITERVRSEAVMEELARLPGESPNPVLRLDRKGEILYANEASAPVLCAWECAGEGERAPSAWQKLAAEVADVGGHRSLEIEYDERVYSMMLSPVVEAGYVNVYGLDITERRRAERRVQRLLDQQIAVNELALALGETLDLTKVYEIVYEHVARTMDVEAFIVASYDSLEQIIRAEYAVIEGVVRDVAMFPPLPLATEGIGTQSTVIRSGQPLNVRDYRSVVDKAQSEYTVTEQGQLFKGPPPAEARNDSTNSALLVPMKLEGKTVGVAQVQSHRLNAYTDQDIDLLSAMANVAALAMQNASLYGMAQRELKEREQAEQALKDYSERLEEMVNRRTQELEEAQAELVHQERMAVLGQLAAGVAHELRNPLGAIANGLYYFQVSPHVNRMHDEASDMLEIMSEEVRRAVQIIQDLSDLALTHGVKRRIAEVGALIDAAIEHQPPPAQIEVHKEISDDIPAIEVDTDQIRRVIERLLENAYHSGTSVVELGACRRGQVVAISVRDAGDGILPQHMERLFEPLFTTKAQGIGLGLALSKKLAEANGGTIEVKSKVGEGSDFVVLLPAV